MDDQHRTLMDAINALRLALVRGAGQEKISELLDELIDSPAFISGAKSD